MRRPAAVLGVAIALAGCGGGGGGGGTSAAEYRQAATRICDDANRRAAALKRPTDVGALRDYLDQTLAIVARDTERLRALQPPDDLRAAHEAALRAQDAAVRGLRALLARLKTSKPTVKDLQGQLDGVQRLSDRADRQFRVLGLPHCAS